MNKMERDNHQSIVKLALLHKFLARSLAAGMSLTSFGCKAQDDRMKTFETFSSERAVEGVSSALHFISSFLCVVEVCSEMY